jgi:predicted MFS family arabinose efflux permease
MMTPQTLAIVPALFEPKERGAAFALFGLSAGLAAVTGPVLGGFLIGQDIWGLGWRPIFLVNIPVGIVAILAALRFVPEVPGSRDLRNDYPGIAIAGAALLLVIFPLIEGRQAGWPWWCFAMMAAAVPVAALFVAWLKRQQARGGPQVLSATLLANRPYLLGTGLTALLFSGIPGFFLVLALYLQNGYGLTPLQSGLTTLPFSLGVLASSILSGRLGARWQVGRIAAGAALLSLAMLWLRVTILATGDSIDWAQFALPLALGGLGLGTTISPMFQTVLSTISGRDTGSASGALQAVQQVGSALGVAIMGEIFFSRLAATDAGSTASHALYASAITQAILYNTAAFLLIAVSVPYLFRSGRLSRD